MGIHEILEVIGASTVLIGGFIFSMYILAIVTESVDKRNKIKYKRKLKKKQMFKILLKEVA